MLITSITRRIYARKCRIEITNHLEKDGDSDSSDSDSCDFDFSDTSIEQAIFQMSSDFQVVDFLLSLV